ncbi:hypothetical protein D9M71_765340 [compost metagenome]
MPLMPATEAVLMIEPPLAFMACSSWTMQLKTPVRLTSSMRCQSARPWSSVKVGAAKMPALLKAMSS